MSTRTHDAGTIDFKHGWPSSGWGLVAYADIRNSTAISKCIGPARFYNDLLRPLYRSWSQVANQLSRSFKGWHEHGPKWIGDGALIALVRNKHGRVSPSKFVKFITPLAAWGYLVGPQFRKTPKGVRSVEVCVGITQGSVYLAREPTILHAGGRVEKPILKEEIVGYTVNHAAKLSNTKSTGKKFSWKIRVTAGKGIEEKKLRSILAGRGAWKRKKEILEWTAL